MTADNTDVLSLLSEDQLKSLDELILNSGYIQCLKFIKDETGCHLREAMNALPERETQIGYVRSIKIKFPTFDELINRCEELKPVAIHAAWDGDTQGWFVVLEAVVKDEEAQDAYKTVELGMGRGASGDLRLFNGQVPPWPEAIEAETLGKQLANHLGVPFHFPSPDRPDF